VHLLAERDITHALLHYQAVSFDDPETGNRFFETFGPGTAIQEPDRPYERFSDYEELLQRLRAADPEKYKRMHKGTPFFFLAWNAFDLRNYEKALFYLDAGIAEDIRNFLNRWQQLPGARFFTLDVQARHVAGRTSANLRSALQRGLERFNAVRESNGAQLPDVDAFVSRFVCPLLVADVPEKRTIPSAFYVFLWEFEDRRQELELRSASIRGSIQPFVLHLFKGGLIFESLLKLLYPSTDTGVPTRTLGGIFGTRQFREDFRLTNIGTSANSLGEIHGGIRDGDNSMLCAFSTAAKLRNATGHDLVQDDIFDDPKRYCDLFEQEMNAIFYVVSVKFP
jgi:hypothetical protein